MLISTWKHSKQLGTAVYVCLSQLIMSDYCEDLNKGLNKHYFCKDGSVLFVLVQRAPAMVKLVVFSISLDTKEPDPRLCPRP